ncbi:MAG TPA: Hint domain-containing protein [Candidatus Brocadiia bacterium]|nr:Hint domain-containing protein [Candidatus Brocadiia bacterium]
MLELGREAAKGVSDPWQAYAILKKTGHSEKQIADLFNENPGAYCFAAGTPIRTPNGVVPIERIKEGDMVLASVDGTEPSSPLAATVSAKSANKVDEVVELDLGVERVRCTPGHLLWIHGRGWTEAGNLLAGDSIPTAGGGLAAVGAVERVRGAFRVYNFETPGFGTYYAGKVGILAHNATGPCSADDAKNFAKNLVNANDPAMKEGRELYASMRTNHNNSPMRRRRANFFKKHGGQKGDHLDHKIPLRVAKELGLGGNTTREILENEGNWCIIPAKVAFDEHLSRKKIYWDKEIRKARNTLCGEGYRCGTESYEKRALELLQEASSRADAIGIAPSQRPRH